MGTERADGTKRREEILDAALACFAEKGVAATGIEDVRKRSGASPSSIYHHFGSLEAITLGLLERTFTRLFAHLADRVVPTTTAKSAVLALALGQIDWVLAHRTEARVMYQAMTFETSTRVVKPLAKKKAELLAPVVMHFGRFVAAGTLPKWGPLEFDVVILGAIHEACRRHLAGAQLRAEWMRETLPRLAWAAVAAEIRESKAARSERR